MWSGGDLRGVRKSNESGARISKFNSWIYYLLIKLSMLLKLLRLQFFIKQI